MNSPAWLFTVEVRLGGTGGGIFRRQSAPDDNVGAKVSPVRPDHSPAFSPDKTELLSVTANLIENSATKKRLKVSPDHLARREGEFYVEAFERPDFRDSHQRHGPV